MFEFIEEPLDEVTLFVERPIASMRPAPVRSRRNDRCCTSVQDRIVEVFGIVGPIGDDGLAGDVLDQGRGVQHITTMTGAGDQADGVAEAVGGRVELGTQPTF